MKPEDIIKRPIITEKSNSDIQVGKYTFEVAKNATKIQIADAVKTYLAKGGKEVKVDKKYKDSIDEFMGA